MNSKQLFYLSKKEKKKLPTVVNSVRHGVSMKSRTCVYCGCEIPRGDMYFSYKPIFDTRKDRCIQHPPKIYNDYERFDI